MKKIYLAAAILVLCFGGSEVRATAISSSTAEAICKGHGGMTDGAESSGCIWCSKIGKTETCTTVVCSFAGKGCDLSSQTHTENAPPPTGGGGGGKPGKESPIAPGKPVRASPDGK